MYFQNLSLEPLDYDVLKSDLLREIENEETPTLDEVKNALAEMYFQANEALANQYYSNVETFKKVNKETFSFSLAGSGLWEKLRKFFCDFLSASSTASEIIDKILEWVASIIPGGIFIGYLVRKIIKYLLNLGYESLCPVSE